MDISLLEVVTWELYKLKYFAIPSKRVVSLICKQVSKHNLTLLPILLVEFSIETLNEESPVANPEIHKGLGISLKTYSFLVTGRTKGKASFNSGDKPLLSEARKSNILLKPSDVKCSFF